jgi:hypothetical protein
VCMRGKSWKLLLCYCIIHISHLTWFPTFHSIILALSLPSQIQSQQIVSIEMDCYALLSVLPCCCSRSTVVDFRNSVEAEARRDVAIWNCGVRKSDEYLICTRPRWTCHEASGSKGICAEITVPVIPGLEVCEGSQDSTCWEES